MAFNGSFSFTKTKFGHAEISVPKIGILMLKTTCTNPWPWAFTISAPPVKNKLR